MMGDILVLAVLGVIVVLVIRSMWKNHKEGKTCGSCAGNCSGCARSCKREVNEQSI
ncbi:MAG: FeoB-associated Cys-rich membrane protein [Faecalimonas sp.]|nr:FeoB-associated Cys-rich membrane protein [Faecalimonas sp.]